jgi:hypothetical protein
MCKRCVAIIDILYELRKYDLKKCDIIKVVDCWPCDDEGIYYPKKD